MTVLFKKDWYRNGRLIAIPDYKTKNKTFIHVAEIYKKLGVENYNFMLCLYDIDLIGVDPHSLNDETDPGRIMRKKVARECRRNMWYILREVVQVRSQGGTTIPYQASRGNIMMTWCFMLSLNFFVMMPRQTGKSMGASILYAAVLYIFGENMTLGIFNQNAKLRLANIGRIVACRDYFPDYLRVETKNGDKTNSEGLVYAHRKNELITMIAQSDPIAADTGARGLSIGNMMWDEFGLGENIAISHPVGMSTMDAARASVISNGMPGASMMLSTAPDPDTESGAYCCRVLEEGIPWTEKLVDLPDRQTVLGVVEKNSKNNTVIGIFSHLMLGKSNEWLKTTVRNNNVSRELLFRDYLNIPTSMSGNPVLTKNQIAEVTASRREIVYLQRKHYYAIYWFISKDIVESVAFKEKTLVVAMDSSNLVNGDGTSFVILDPNSGHVVGSMHFKEGLLDQLGVFIGDMLVAFPKMIFVPENRSSGQSLIDGAITVLLHNGFNPFYRIYNDIVQHRSEAWAAKIDISNADLARTHYRKHFGYKTNPTIRSDLYGTTLQKALDYGGRYIHDPKIITQLTALSLKTGRVDHVAGGHDDAVISFLLAWNFVLNGRNLSLYGAESFTLVPKAQITQSPETRQWAAYQEKLSEDFYNIKKALLNTRDPQVRANYIREHDRIASKIDRGLIQLPDTADALYTDLNTYLLPKGTR